MSRRKRKTRLIPPAQAIKAKEKFTRSFQWLVASGLLAIILPIVYQFLFGNILLEFIQPLGRGYEFQLKNETPSDRVVNQLRVVPPNAQQVVFKTTQGVYAEQDEHGNTVLPGGNTSYVPAAEFKELDGRLLPANSTIKFRVPPLSSRSWMEPEATIVDVKYEITSSNIALAGIESALNAVGLHTREKSIRYLVVSNYWTVTQSTSPNEAIRIACRDDDSLAKHKICDGWR